MAKRFTDTGKWAKPSFDRLSLKMKLVWIYLCDNCDHAGIWDFNLRLLEFHLSVEVTESEFKQSFGDKVTFLSPTKVFLPSFVEFQYGELNPENRVHQSVLSRLKKEGAYKALVSPLQGAKDKEKDKDKDSSLRGGVGEIFKPDLEALYKSYPRKQGKAKGLGILKASIKTEKAYSDYQKAQARFIAHLEASGTEAEFVPHFKTFAGSWRDWLDPDAGTVEGIAKKKTDLEMILEFEREDIANGWTRNGKANNPP